MSYQKGETAMRGDIVKRLRGQYPVGPMLSNGEPEFGYREYVGILVDPLKIYNGWHPALPIMEEAAVEIETLRADLSSVQNYREIILKFIGSLTLADHMGDVTNDIEQVLGLLGIKIEWNDLTELGTALGNMGVTTLRGTSLE